MAITNAQQYKQLVNPPLDGKRPGYRGDDAGRAERERNKEAKAAGKQTTTTRADPDSGRGPVDKSTPTQTANQLRNQNRFVAEDFDLLPGDTPVEDVDIPLTTRERITNENRDLFINKPANYGKYTPPAIQFLANLNRQPNRRFFYERVLKNNAQGLNYTELEKAYQEYMTGRMSGETDAMGRTIISSGRDDDQPIIPIQTGIMTQDSGIMNQETDEEEEEPFERALAFRADGGRVGAMGGGIMGGLADGQMDEMGRQMYGLGKLVKKATRAVKKIVKSPIGKAALLYTGAGALGNLAGGSGLGGMFTNILSPKKFLARDSLTKIFGKEGLTNIFLGGGSGADKFSGLIGAGGEIDPFRALTAVSTIAALTPEQEAEAQLLADTTGLNIDEARNQILKAAAGQDDFRARAFKAGGGLMRLGYQEGGDAEPVAKKTMPLLDMDGKEKDYRETGGFVDMGRMERADDVPARLSKNEFVFTADAVRNAGEGDIDKGAEVMYNMMKNLEAGGEVSEESQGLEGARRMFQTSQRLEEVL